MKTKNKMSHTPAPWRVVMTREDEKGWNLSAEAHKDWPAAIQYKVKDETREIGCEEAEANARLIAAAPDLLEAAKATTDLLAEWDAGEGEITIPFKAAIRALRAARAAIAKAEGN